MASISFEKAIEIALEQHRAGQFKRAEQLYLEILRQDPGNVDAMHLLGVLAHQGKRPDLAEQFIGRAIGRRGDVAVFHYNLAEAYRAQSKFADAAASYRRAVELEPEYAEAHNNLSIVLGELRDAEGAAAAARRATELQPDAAAPFNNLGNALRAAGGHADAEAAYRRAIELRPDFAEAMTNLGVLLGLAGRVEESVDWFRRAIRLAPADPVAHNNLGGSLARLGRHAEAAEAFETATRLRPDFAEATNNLGAALRSLGHAEAAIPHFRKVIEADPDFMPARFNLFSCLKELSRNAEALEVIDAALSRRPDLVSERFMRAMVLRDLQRMDESVAEVEAILAERPDDVPAATALAYARLERGDMDGARAMLDRVVALRPDAQSFSNVLMTMDYHPAYTPAELLDAHRVWAEVHEAPSRPTWPVHDNDRDPGRRLRVGYISPDFRGHVVGHFLKPILENHDHDRFEVFGYANLTNVDMHTWEMRAQIDHWRETASMSPDRIAQQIRDDRIDVLVELAGHTGGNALPTLARKPAPVQINMIGFPGTTGLSAIDYRVTDARCDPPGVADEHSSERLIRMPRLFWVFRPSPQSPPVGPLPADGNGHLTFTSVNNFTKVTPATQAMWARLLGAVPGSRLIIQTAAMQSPQAVRAVRERFAAAGVDPARLDFRPFSDLARYLQLLNESDLTLDPFPFNGGTTTCHSLWMGAPVLTLAGDRHASRMGLSMMTAVGLPEFVAHTPDEYVEIGARMTGDLSHLREVRRTMRDRLNASPLLDGPGYTRELEAAFREAWASWCATGA